MILKCFQKQSYILYDFVSLLKEDLDDIVNIIIFESSIEVNIISIDMCLNETDKIIYNLVQLKSHFLSIYISEDIHKNLLNMSTLIFLSSIKLNLQ
jgi:hypothetical protein